MKLAAKLVLLFLVCLSLVVTVFSYLSVQQAKELALSEHERHAADLAATIQSALERYPGAQEDLGSVLSSWSREVQHVQIRIVNPRIEQEYGRGFDPRLAPAVPLEQVLTLTQVTTFRQPDQNGNSMIHTYVPLSGNISNLASGSQLEVSAPESFWTERLVKSLRSSSIALLAVSVASSVVILLGGFWMVGRPLESLVEKVHRISQGDLTEPIKLHRSDELGSLGNAVNEMCEQLSRQRDRIELETEKRVAAVEQLRHADRLRTVGRLAAGLAHEIGTPLNVVSGRAELISSGKLTSEQVHESAIAIKNQSTRIAGIVSQLLDFARRNLPNREQADLNTVVKESIELLRTLAQKRDVELVFRPFATAAIAKIDAAQMQQVVTNLVVNALQASTEKGEVVVEICPVREEGHELWSISVRDNGVGIEPEVLDSIFEPFFTTKDVGDGTGLGLSISHGIVHEHGGTIHVESEVDNGSTFTILLPRDQATGGDAVPTSPA